MSKSGLYPTDFKRIASFIACCLVSIIVLANSATGSDDTNTNPALIIRGPKTELAEYQYLRAYSEELLALALSKSGHSFEFQQIAINLGNGGRIARFIEQGRYDVNAFHTTPILEKTLAPIRIPIFKGIVGLRLPVIRAEDRESFAAINNIRQLQDKVAVQGFDWPDLSILASNGLPIRTGVDVPAMRHLLANQRADYFPRSVVEVWQEDSLFHSDGLVVEPNLALYYRSASYFFVNKRNNTLKTAIETGLELAIADGSFDEVFYRYFGNSLNRANLSARTILEIKNPNLTAATPLQREELWFVKSENYEMVSELQVDI